MTQWENLPEPRPERPVGPVAPSWSGFTADPRVAANQHLRASDADRDFATRLIQQARVEGRLDAAEHDERTLQAANARTLGELAPVVSDLMVANAAPGLVTDRAPAQAARVVLGRPRGAAERDLAHDRADHRPPALLLADVADGRHWRPGRDGVVLAALCGGGGATAGPP
jgi:hypothetical protein